MSGIDDLKGIGKEKIIVVKDSSGLDNILKIEQKMVGLYKEFELSLHSFNYYLNKFDFEEQMVYFYGNMMYEMNTSSGLILPYSLDDIIDYIRIRSESIVLGPEITGMMPSALLEHITIKNNKEGKETRFHIDGKGKKFHYLFYNCRNVDKLLIENFEGSFICKNIAQNKGNANLVVIKDIIGSYTAREAALRDGKIKNLVLINCDGEDSLLLNENHYKKFDLIIDVNNSYTDMKHAGPSFGDVGLYYLDYDSTTVQECFMAGRKIDLMIIKGTNKNPAVWLEQPDSINNFFYMGRNGDKYYRNEKIKTLKIGKIDKKRARKYKVDEIVNVAAKLKTAKMDEVVDSVNKISDLYESVRTLNNGN